MYIWFLSTVLVWKIWNDRYQLFLQNEKWCIYSYDSMRHSSSEYRRTFSVMKLFLTAAAADLTASSSSAPDVTYHDIYIIESRHIVSRFISHHFISCHILSPTKSLLTWKNDFRWNTENHSIPFNDSYTSYNSFEQIVSNVVTHLPWLWTRLWPRIPMSL
jgi:uncharacterized protein involved in tolerance to divalent cations